MDSRSLSYSAWNFFTVCSHLNEALKKYSPLTITAGTVATVLILQKAHYAYTHWDTKKVKDNLVEKAMKMGLFIPVVKQKIQKELDQVNKALEDIRVEVDREREKWEQVSVLPAKGIAREKILERLASLQGKYHEGKHSGAVYTSYDESTLELLQTVWAKTALTNPMHSAWPLLNLMESEIVSMCQHLMHGELGTPGIMTHGGTTSIYEACIAYVKLAREKGIREPEIIVPGTVHVAFDKAAKDLGVKLVKVPVDPATGGADVAAMKKKINSHTCLLVGSAPSFPYGIMDPIEELGQLAKQYQLPLHVDACLGGFINAFAEEAGVALPKFDFRVEGVTSISMDTHKYGQTPKGSSVLLFHPDCEASTARVHLDWEGGMYVTPTMDGSRSGADIAVAWAALVAKGREAYVADAKAIFTLQKKLIEKINQIDGIEVAYQPLSCVVGIKCKPELNILVIENQLKDRGWELNILQTSAPKADGIHFCLTAVHARQPDFLSDFIAALKESVTYSKDNPLAVPRGTAKVYGSLAKGIPFFIQQIIGDGYVRVKTTLREENVVPGFNQ